MCEEAEKICRNFIWGSTADQRKCHLVSWEKLCCLKADGGLGFRNLKVLIKAHMMKLAWSMISQTHKLWVRIMRAKHSCGIYTVPKFCYKTNYSSTWKTIVKAWEEVKPNLIWVINNGHDTRFRKDNWIPGVGALADILDSSIPQTESEFHVCHYASNGNWNWQLVENIIPASICDKIAYLKPPSSSSSDFPYWNLSSDGDFPLKTAYKYILKHKPPVENQNPIFRKVWKWPGPSRIKTTLWKICHTKLMTNVERKTRGMTADELCPRCCKHLETIMHMARDCEEVREFWSSLINPSSWSKFFSVGLHNWMDWDLSSNNIGTHHLDWPIVFGIAVHEVWKDKNSLVFARSSSMRNNLTFLVLNQANFIADCNGPVANGQ